MKPANPSTPAARSTPLKAACALAALAALAWPAAAGAVTATAPDSHYFFGTPTGMTVLPPDLPEVAGAGTYTSGPATATFTLAPQASVVLDLTGPSYVGAAFEYSYSITGPGFINPGDTVAGTLTTSMSASGTGTLVAAAALEGTGLTLGADTGVCFATVPGVCLGTYGTSLTNESIPLSFSSSGVLEIATAARVLSGSAHASIDPVITLPAGYTITLSAGVGNGSDSPPSMPVSAVPEPSTWLSLGAGLGLLGVSLRRKNEQARTAFDRA